MHSMIRSSLLSRRSGAALALATCSALLFGASSLAAQGRSSTRYDIHFHRPVAVGARARIEVEGTKQTVMERRNGRTNETMRDDTTQVRFLAVERVLAVSASGKPTTVEYTVEAFEVTTAGQRSTPLAAGSVLTVVRATQPGAEPTMTVNGRPVAEPVAEALGIVISRRQSETSDDDVFGSPTPRRVGERWGINAELAQRELASGGAPDMRLTGNVRATEATTVDSMACLVLTATMRGQLRGIPNMPPTATFRTGTVDLTMTGAFPVDGTSRPPTGQVSMVMDVTFTVAGATPAATQTIHMVVRESRSEHITPLP